MKQIAVLIVGVAFSSVVFGKANGPLFRVETSNLSLGPDHQYQTSCTVFADKLERKVQIAALKNESVETNSIKLKNAKELTGLISVVANADFGPGEPAPVGGERVAIEGFSSIENKWVLIQEEVGGLVTQTRDANVTNPIVSFVQKICR
jgi:hypothetical protein